MALERQKMEDSIKNRVAGIQNLTKVETQSQVEIETKVETKTEIKEEKVPKKTTKKRIKKEEKFAKAVCYLDPNTLKAFKKYMASKHEIYTVSEGIKFAVEKMIKEKL